MIYNLHQSLNDEINSAEVLLDNGRLHEICANQLCVPADPSRSHMNRLAARALSDVTSGFRFAQSDLTATGEVMSMSKMLRSVEPRAT